MPKDYAKLIKRGAGYSDDVEFIPDHPILTKEQEQHLNIHAKDVYDHYVYHMSNDPLNGTPNSSNLRRINQQAIDRYNDHMNRLFPTGGRRRRRTKRRRSRGKSRRR